MLAQPHRLPLCLVIFDNIFEIFGHFHVFQVLLECFDAKKNKKVLDTDKMSENGSAGITLRVLRRMLGSAE